MTTIKYERKEDKARVSVHGHAGYNPGNDIVCAALSCLTFTMLNTLDEYESEGHISDVIYDMADGHTIVSFKVVDDYWDIAWRVIEIGYECISEEYPNNVWFDK